MENTNHFTMIFPDLESAESLGKALESEGDFYTNVTTFFQDKGIELILPESFGFDFYERNGLIINGCFISGSTDVNDFMSPLSKVVRYMYGEIIDDEVCRSLRFGFCDGKRTSLQDCLDKLLEAFDTSSLGRAGQYIEAQNRLDKDKSYALRVALVNRKKISIIQELLEQGADANSRNNDGYSCLELAITNKNAGAVSLLLEHGADVSSRSCSKGGAITYLFEACRFESPKIVETLLKYGAEPNLRDSYFRQLPIQMAIENHMAKSVKQLIAYGADAHINLLKHTSESFHSNYCGKLNRKFDIFKTLLKIPEIKNDFLDKKDKYLRLINKNFKKMHPEIKDKKDFEKMYEYLLNIT